MIKHQREATEILCYTWPQQPGTRKVVNRMLVCVCFWFNFFSRLLKFKIVMKFESQQDSFEDRLIRYKSDGYFWNIDTNHSISNKSNFFLLLPSRLIIFLLLMSRLICSNLSSFFLAGSTASHHQQKTPTYLSETFPLSWTDHQTRSAILGERNRYIISSNIFVSSGDGPVKRRLKETLRILKT